MGYPSLRTIPWVKQQAKMLQTMETVARFAGMPKGPQRATIVDVNDPEDRGRVRVVFDAHNAIDVPQVEGAGVYSQSRNDYDWAQYTSHWIDTSPAFKGKQPIGLLGKRVNVVLSGNDYKYAVLQDVLYDPQVLTDTSVELLKIPNNSPMTRLPVYPAGQLPLPCEENAGCMVIEEGGPMNSDWTCVCLKRDGKYIWVRHSDLAHGHAGGNDVTSQVNAGGYRPGPGQVASIYDHVFVTSHQEMNKANRTAFSSEPAGNPWGIEGRWHAPPMAVDSDGNKIAAQPFYTGDLFDQAKALDFTRSTSGYTDKITGGFTSSFNPKISSAVESVPGYNAVAKLLDKGQEALKVAEAFRKAVENPTAFVTDVALASAQSFIPASTRAALESQTNPQGLISTVYSSLKGALGFG